MGVLMDTITYVLEVDVCRNMLCSYVSARRLLVDGGCNWTSYSCFPCEPQWAHHPTAVTAAAVKCLSLQCTSTWKKLQFDETAKKVCLSGPECHFRGFELRLLAT